MSERLGQNPVSNGVPEQSLILSEGTKFGGSEKYGRWFKELQSVDDMEPLYLEWRDKVIEASRGADVLNFLDAGCGNGALAIPFAKSLSRSKATHAYLVDIQEEGIEEVREVLKSYPTPSNLSFEPVVGDLSHLPSNIPENSLHGILSTWVFHWLTEEKMKETLIEFERTLAPGGQVMLEACSVFNQLGVRRNNDEELAKVLRETDNGQATHPYQVDLPRYGKSAYLFTEPTMRQIVQGSGLTIQKLEWRKFTGSMANGQPDNYRESIQVLAQKL